MVVVMAVLKPVGPAGPPDPGAIASAEPEMRYDPNAEVTDCVTDSRKAEASALFSA